MEADNGIVWKLVDGDSFDKDEFDRIFMAGVRAGSARRKAEAKLPPPRPDHKEKLFRLTNLAVQSYNSNHQNDQFELVDPLHLQRSFTNDYDYSREIQITNCYHLSFIARSKNDESYLKFFFAEVSLTSDTVLRCFIVEPDTRARPPPLSPRSRHFCANRFLSKAYTIKSGIEHLITEEVDELKRTAYPYAVKAIETYNYFHDSAFMALEIVACVRFRLVDIITDEDMWAHLIFKTMHKDHSLPNASPDYFFAEVGIRRESSKTETSCAVCREHCPMFHPGEDEDFLHCNGQFADALYEDKAWAQKARLEQKDGESIKAARLEYWEELEHLQW